MKFALGLCIEACELPNEFLTGEALTEIAQVVEAHGYDALSLSEHPFPVPPVRHHPDPAVTFAAIAAVTSTLRLQMNLFIPAYRNPFLAAKAISTLDVISGGRVIIGVGTGYLEPEFQALGMTMEQRNERTDQAIEMMKRAWSGEPVQADGPGYTTKGNNMLPRPTQRPNPPFWVGGNSKRAIRRAVELCDGWLPYPNPPHMAASRRTPSIQTVDDLRARIEYGRRLSAERGRTAPVDVSYIPVASEPILHDASGSKFSYEVGPVVEHVKELADAGVTYLNIMLPGHDRATYLEHVKRFSTIVEAVAPIAPGAGM